MANISFDLAGFNKIPKKYANASFSKKNDYENYLPIDYQIWGGSNLNKSVTVRFSKSKRVEDSALTTFPYNLLSENGAYRDLNVPQTHTSWMGLVKNENNGIII